MKIETVGLLGCGRFGRMVHEYLSPEKQVTVYDPDSRRLSGLPNAASFEKVLASQLIILCVPISSVEQLCKRMAGHLQAGQTVVDTCSVKQHPVQWMLAHLPESVGILGAHPLFGPDSGKEGIAGLKIVLCPVRIDPVTYRQICRYLDSLQLVIIEATPEEHDHQIAQSQAIFHLIAEAMKRLGWGGQTISTPGPETFYRLLKTVQQDTEQLFFDLERENPHTAHYRREFIRQIIELDKRLFADNS